MEGERRDEIMAAWLEARIYSLHRGILGRNLWNTIQLYLVTGIPIAILLYVISRLMGLEMARTLCVPLTLTLIIGFGLVASILAHSYAIFASFLTIAGLFLVVDVTGGGGIWIPASSPHFGEVCTPSATIVVFLAFVVAVALMARTASTGGRLGRLQGSLQKFHLSLENPPARTKFTVVSLLDGLATPYSWTPDAAFHSLILNVKAARIRLSSMRVLVLARPDELDKQVSDRVRRVHETMVGIGIDREAIRVLPDDCDSSASYFQKLTLIRFKPLTRRERWSLRTNLTPLDPNLLQEFNVAWLHGESGVHVDSPDNLRAKTEFESAWISAKPLPD